jgi:hypothetical protein
MKLTSENLEKVFMDCLYREEEINYEKSPENAVLVEGIVLKVGFHPERLEANRETVRDFLTQIPEAFHKDTGGGWSFLQLPFTKEGGQWGEQRNAEQLMVLAVGLKLMEYCLPRDIWSALPGGVPYLVVV